MTLFKLRSGADISRHRTLIAYLLLCVVVFLWAYWTTLTEAAEKWVHEPQYSHGYLVPMFAAVLLWLRRHTLQFDAWKPSWWGVPVLVAGLVVRFAGAHFYFVWFDAISLLPCMAGLFLMAGGKSALVWSWPSIAFLVFMIPLPYSAELMMGGPLQRVATLTSTFALQTLGFPALADGTVILLNEVSLGIVEACSGLRMLVVFFALSTAVALVIRRPLWEKILILVSAIPIALFVNIIRITVTGILHDTVGSEIANAVFHDLAGWLMMPLALVFLGIELTILKYLLLEPVGSPSPMTLNLSGMPQVSQPSRRGRKNHQSRQPFGGPVEPSKQG
ncbi:MAG TPA: exosortase/archaeosortase family protein [Gemmataceae bacterium]|nr:exosortase/archaeosortase family protein [Gemmataceae bacterium]